LSDQVSRFKSYTARRIIDGLEQYGFAMLLEELRFFKRGHKIDQTHQLWQEGSHPQQIQNDEMMIQKLEYMHLNPVRRGYMDDPVHWRYSSARNYAERVGLIEVVTDWRGGSERTAGRQSLPGRAYPGRAPAREQFSSCSQALAGNTRARPAL